MIEKTKKRKTGSISEEDISTLLQRYTATQVLALLQEVAQFPDVKLNWDALVKKTSTGISNAREYQMLWRHLAYRDSLVEKLDDGAQPLDDDSDLEYELEPYPSVSSEASAEAAACVKVLIASGLPSDSSLTNNSTVEAPLTINIPNGQSLRASLDLKPTASIRGMNITVPVSVQRQASPAVTLAETSLEGNGPVGANVTSRRKRKPWSEAEDMELIAAVQKCGVGNWANILRGDFKGERTASQLAQRWTIIKKRLGNLNVEGNSNIPQLSEAQLATRSALSLALDMPDKSLAAACTNNPGLKTTPNNSALPTTSVEPSVHTPHQPPQGPSSSVSAPNQPQKPPIVSVSAHTQPQKAPTVSVSSHNQPQKAPTVSVSSHNQPQKAPTVSLSSHNQPHKCSTTPVLPHNQPQKGPTTTSISAHNQSVKGATTVQQGPVAPVQTPNQSQHGPMATKTSPRGSSIPTLKSRVTLKKPPVKTFSTTGAILDATAVAAGARIGSPMAAATLLKAAQSKNAIHIMTSNGPSIKPVMSSGTSSHLDVNSNAQNMCTGPTAESLSCPVTSTVPPGSARSSVQRSDHTPSASSSSLNLSNQQCSAVTSSLPADGPVNEELDVRVLEGSTMDGLLQQENGACMPKNEPGEGVKENKPAMLHCESESKNIEAVADHPSEKATVEVYQADVTTNPVEDRQNTNDPKFDNSLVKKSDSQPLAEDSFVNQSVTKTPAEVSSTDGCSEVLSTEETDQAT